MPAPESPAHDTGLPVSRVAVITVSYGSSGVLDGFLASVPAASASPVAVVIADNKPEGADGVRDLAVANGAEYLPLAGNPGYGGAINAAVKNLPPTVEWILVSNPDLVLGAGSIDFLLTTGDSNPTIAAVGPAIVTKNEVYPSARSIPSLRNGIGHALFANVWLGNPWTKAYRKDSQYEAIRRDAGWLSGACVLVRRSAFESLGGFDEMFFMYFEDVDLGYRLGKSGFRNVYEPAAVVEHSGAHSTESPSESARMIAVHHESALRFLGKKYSGPLLWPVRFVLGIGLSIRSAVLKRRSGHH
ncbi:glycosyltransferase family 2 protein [Frigoribacterium sp. UYMn621]|uniref:glycosyltransferase family 2 protein n=1 Tax=Frigoribacterium sp. UYMn621 TaxID=3156343 RepID=UPI00339B1B3C